MSPEGIDHVKPRFNADDNGNPMRKSLLTIVVLVGIAGLTVVPSAQDSSTRNRDTETIRRMLTRLHDNAEFTGTVLVARAGVPVYRDTIARTADQARALAAPSDIGSLAKAFTAMAVMMLAEQGKLKYDDPIDKHLPDLAGAAPGITIRHLLTHTSGIPDVGDLGIDRPNLLERDVIDAIRANHTRFARPGLRYRYSNAGYMLVAMVVERESGQAFDDFLRAKIFVPLAMNHTRPVAPRLKGLTKGDGGIASTVDDLVKWDQALAAGKLIGAKTLADAFVPARVEEGTSTYAFGWNVAQRNGDTLVWHTGNSGDRRAFLGRRVRDRITVIILTQGDSRRPEIADAIFDILRHRPFTPPRLSVARKMLAIVDSKGVDGAIALYHQLKTAEPNAYDFSETQLNGVGYALLGRRDTAGAIRVFELNAQQFPKSSNVFDSLGEALAAAGRRDDAVKAYSRAVEIDPGNINAQTMLKKLK
jgi:CubicO group peptidase (beta-lactamase class C family)